jgi:histidinol-phosphatase
VHIALEVDGEIVVGVITRPAAGTRWWAARGAGAFAGSSDGDAPPRRLRVSGQTSLDRAQVRGWLLDGDPRKARLQSLPGWAEPVTLDCLMRVAEGELEVYYDGSQSRIWDRAPLVVILEEAGGRYRDLKGGRDLDRPGGLFTNGLIDAELAVLLGI